MLKPIFSIAVEVLLGVAAAGCVLATVVPFLINADVIVIGDGLGSLLIAGVLGAGAGLMLLRPGGTLRRRSK